MLYDNTIDNDKAFRQRIAELRTGTDFETATHETTVNTLVLGDAVTTCYGGASFTHCDEYNVYNFEVTLGPANAHRLVEFLRALPDEPQDG